MCPLAYHQEGHAGVAEVLLLAGGAEVDAQIGDGSTALYIACFNGHERVANLVQCDSLTEYC